MENLFKNLSESVSEECYNEILDMVEALLTENELEKQKADAIAALKTLYKTYNSGKRHYNKASKKQEGKRQAGVPRIEGNDEISRKRVKYIGKTENLKDTIKDIEDKGYFKDLSDKEYYGK